MATSAGNVESKVTITASTNGLEKATMQVLKQQLAFEKLNTQAARTAQIQARTNAIEQQNIAKKAKLEAQTRKVAQQTEKYAATVAKARTQQSLFNKVIDAGKLLSGVYALKTIGNSFIDLIRGSADYIENMNLFNVVMGQSKEKAENFINKMHDALGLDTSKLMEYMGTFKGMANNMGIVEDKAYDMSEGLTKLAYDLSSFYNTSIEQAFTSLSSAITGQTKSIREQFNGIDVTMGTLQTELDRLGIDKTTSDLSYAEKSVLRYISILRQSQSAQGDFARTMMSPSQMMKQMTERVATLARAFGNMFIPLLRAVLPYVLAVTGALTTLFNTISKFLGFEPMTFDYEGISTGMGGVSDDIDSVGDSADKSNKKVKEFKKQLQGFDVLNVITTPTDSSSGGKGGSGGGGFGGIDPRLLAAIDNYNNRLDLASDKVKKLQAAIEDFFSKIDFDPLKKSLDNLWESMKLVGNFTWQSLKDFYNQFLVPVGKWVLGEGLPRFVDAIANGLAKIDWDNLNAKLYYLWQQLAPFAIHVGEGLLWFFEKVLVPLTTWTISDVLPIFLEALTSALKILNNAIEVASPLLNWLWDNFLSKIASFVGGTVVGFLQGIADALKLIANNKAASTVLTGVLVAITGLAAIRTVKSLLDTSNGLAAIINKGSQSSKVLTILSGALKGTKVELAEGANKSQIFSAFLKNIGSSAKTVGSSILTAGANFLKFGKNVATGQVSVKNLGNTLSGTLKNSFSGVTKSLKDFTTKLKSSISSYSTTASAATKLGITLSGAAGLVVSLKATKSAMQDVAKQGEMTASSAGKLAVGLAGAAASGAAIGAKFGPLGALIGGIAGGIAGAASSLIEYNKACEEQKVYDKMFDGQGVSIDRIVDSLKNLTNTYSEQLDEIESYNSKVQETKEKLDDTYKSMDTLLSKIASGSYDPSASDFQKIKNDIETLKTTTDELTQTDTDHAINFINQQQQQGKISREEAASRISTALAVQSVENQISQDYAKAMQSLTEDYKNGKLSAQEYATEMQNLKSIYEVNATSADTTKVSVKNLVEEISAKGIDFKNYKKTKEFVDEVGKTYENNKKTVSNYYDEQKKNIENTQILLEAKMQRAKTLYGEDSEQYKAYVDQYNEKTKELSENETSRKTELESLKGTYKGLYEGILAEMDTTGFSATEKGKGIADDINKSLKEIGNVDRSELGNDLYKSITGAMDACKPNIKTKADELGNETKSSFQTKATSLDKSVFTKNYGDAASNAKTAFMSKIKPSETDTTNIKGNYNKMGDSIGKSSMEGQAKGIKNNTGLVKTALQTSKYEVEEFAKSKSVWNINSPSKVTQKWGASIDEGMAKGIKDNTEKIRTAIQAQMKILDAEFKSKKFSISISTNVEGSFNSILSKLETFCSRFRNAINRLASGMSSTMNGIKINDSGKVTYTKMPYINVPRFADGGYPDVGSLFFAGEAGPEWVGNIGNKTGVLNDDQLSNTVANALDKVMSKYYGRTQSLNATIPVYIGQDKIDEKQRQISLRNNNMYGTAR